MRWCNPGPAVPAARQASTSIGRVLSRLQQWPKPRTECTTIPAMKLNFGTSRHAYTLVDHLLLRCTMHVCVCCCFLFACPTPQVLCFLLHILRAPPGSHAAWTVVRSSAPMQLQQSAPNAAGIAPNLANCPVLSPIRCGSPPRQGYLPGQEQQQPSFNPSSRGRGNAGAQAAYPLSDGEQIEAHSSGNQMVVPGRRLRQRPTSPAAAGLLDAAAALAAEVEAGRGDAALLEGRMRYAEDKLLQQVRGCKHRH